MATLSRFSTSTIVASNGLVPWLAAQGPLAYSPVEPPARDYFFQYSWMLPGIFDLKVNLREHRYIESPGFAKDLWHAAQQAYSLDPVMVVQKFGPHHVVVKTSLSNIRLTTFFAGESEVKIIDPSRVSLVEAIGCQVESIPPMEYTNRMISEVSC